jgi:hypothetical protein
MQIPMRFSAIIEASFSPSRNDLILVWGMPEALDDTVGLYVLDLSKNQTNTILVNPAQATVNSVSWISAEQGDSIVYGVELYSPAPESEYFGYEIRLADIAGNEITRLFERSFTKSSEDPAMGNDGTRRFSVIDVTNDGKKLLMSVSIPTDSFFVPSNLTIFDLDKRQFQTVIDGFHVSEAEFSPTDDLIIYDIGTGHRTPGGPLVIMAADGSWSEYVRFSENKPYDDPHDFVVSPDGHRIIARIVEWGGGSSRIVETELAHPVPEVSQFTILMSAAAIGIIMSLVRLRPASHWFT